MNPDYKKYTLIELYDVKDNIDREYYADRYRLLLREIKTREERPENEPESVKLTQRDKVSITRVVMLLCIPFFSWLLIDAFKSGSIQYKGGHVYHLNEQPEYFYMLFSFYSVGLVISIFAVIKGVGAK